MTSTPGTEPRHRAIEGRAGDEGPASRAAPARARAAARLARLGAIARGYPVPAAALALLALAGLLALGRRADLAQWALLAVILLGGVPLLWTTARALLRREFGVDVIAILAIAGSAALGQYLAGAIIVLMLSGGEALEAFALRRARRSLSALVERAPRHAHVRRGDALVTIAADEVAVGMRVVVKPGEIVPVDGVVAAGASGVSEADLTGEPLPVRKEAGSLVLSGSVNVETVLEVEATRPSAESQYAQIVRLVDEAQRHRAPIHRLADRYAVWFTAVTVAATALTWALSGSALDALAVLVVATPCPLILATPIAIMSGVDRAARSGVILKSGAAMEQLGEVDVAVFDKTGTLTLGRPRLVEIARPGRASDPAADGDLLGLVASVEQYSPHILARAVVEAARERGAPLAPVAGVEEAPGQGMRGRVSRRAGVPGAPGGPVDVALGNRKFMRQLGIAPAPGLVAERERRTTEGQIASFLAIEGRAVGLLVFADEPRPDLARLMDDLRAAGIRETVLLTGDGETVARQVGRLAGVDRVLAHCLPPDKVRAVAEAQAAGRKVLMVGDGVNDAPALATATVGMAVGAQGLTASAAVADAILISPDIGRVATAVRLGRHVLRVALEGIWVGMGLSLLAMLFAALGYIPPAAGAILQEGIDVIVILNALRAGGMRPRR